MQNFAGNFGMWGPGSDADPWICVFALDFLHQAKQKGYVVPNEALKRGAGWLQTASTSDSNDDHDARLCLLCAGARMGQVNLSDLRYFCDTRGSEWNNGHRGGAHGCRGGASGRPLARRPTPSAARRDILMDAKPLTYSIDDYGSYVRDLAGTTALAIEGGDAGDRAGADEARRRRQHAPQFDDDAGEGVDAARGL